MGTFVGTIEASKSYFCHNAFTDESVDYGTIYLDGKEWHMFYLGTTHTLSPPEQVPNFPYLTLKAKGTSATGPWTKQKKFVPFRPELGTYYAITTSPGYTVSYKGEYLQFFIAAKWHYEEDGRRIVKRTLGIARTKELDGPWTIDTEPIFPSDEQIENLSLYYEETNNKWFLFTNHIGIENGEEYTDAIWVYWTTDLNRWDPKNKAIVLDGQNCKWSKRIIGLASVLKKGSRLAIFYDGLEGDKISHMLRDIGLAWLDLPLVPPKIPADEPNSKIFLVSYAN